MWYYQNTKCCYIVPLWHHKAFSLLKLYISHQLFCWLKPSSSNNKNQIIVVSVIKSSRSHQTVPLVTMFVSCTHAPHFLIDFWWTTIKKAIRSILYIFTIGAETNTRWFSFLWRTEWELTWKKYFCSSWLAVTCCDLGPIKPLECFCVLDMLITAQCWERSQRSKWSSLGGLRCFISSKEVLYSILIVCYVAGCWQIWN